jgi:diguanylate cyclase (GGDEF)-like protein
LFRRIVTRGQGSRALGIAFELLLAFAGWAAIAVALVALPTRGGHLPLVGALLFLSVSAGARLFAFPLSGLVSGLPTVLSLDAAVVVAGAISVGAPLIAAGVAIILAVDTAVRAGLRRRTGVGAVDGAPAQRKVSILRESLYAGGLAGGLLLAAAVAFGPRLADAREHLWLVPTFGLVFICAHAVLQVLHDFVFGQPVRPTVRRVFLALGAEATLLPLGAVMMLIWTGHRPIAFALLGATYLLVNFGFFRIARITASLRLRVRELHTLQRTAQAMAAEQEVPRLIGALLRELHRALPAAHLIEVRLRPTQMGATLGDRAEPSVERFALEQGRGRVRASTVPPNEWDAVEELSVEDHLDAPIGATRARVIAPLKMYGETLGVLVVDSQKPAPFGEHEARLIEAVTGQAASAIENTRLYALANFDGLTGLHCRRYFDTRLLEEIERARRFDTSFCVVLLDVDDFKKLNDTRGHLAGDRALREVARLAQAQLRNVDLAARYGGEELVFLLPRTTIPDAQLVAERIRDAVGSHLFSEGGRVTVSVGVASFRDTPEDVPMVAANVLGRADVALYRAKSLGKDRVEVELGPIELSPSLAPVTRRRRA